MGNLKGGKPEAKPPNLKPLALVIGVALLGLGLAWALGAFDSETATPTAAAGSAAATSDPSTTTTTTTTSGGTTTTSGGTTTTGGSTIPSCSGGFVNGCNIGAGDAAGQTRVMSACTQRFTKDTTNSSTDYLQCMPSTNGSTCNKWNNANKSDKVECSVSGGLPMCEVALDGHGTWQGRDSPHSNATDLTYRATSRRMCKCPNESAGGYRADGTSVHDTTWFHDSKNLWKCKE